jgi:DnaJ family protein B protein 12
MDGWTLLRQLAPLLILFVLPLLSSLFSGSSTAAGPSYRFDTPEAPYVMGRTTPNLNLNYFVNPLEVDDFSARRFKQLDKQVETDHVRTLRFECENEVNQRERMIQDAQGWFFPDIEKMKEARAMELPNCRRFEKLRGRY